MNASYPLKNLPAPLQALIRPMLFISLALHGLLLLVPTSDQEAEADVEKVEKSVKVTQLPTTPTAASPQASLKTPAPKPETPKVVTPAIRQPAINNRTQPIIQASPSPRRTTQAAPEAKPSPQTATNTSPSSQTVTNTNPGSQTATTSNTALGEFPIFPGAKAGCLEVESCFQTGNPIDKVAAYFTKELPARGFASAENISEPGRKVYEVMRSDFPTQYLSLIETGQGTIYVLAEGPRTLEDLKNAAVVPPEFYTILAEVGEEVDESQFANPQQFYTQLSRPDKDGSLLLPEERTEIEGMKLIPGQAPDAAYASILPNLQSIFEVSESGGYGGGSLYKLKKGSFTGYLNLVPSKDGTGTVIVLWTEPPA